MKKTQKIMAVQERVCLIQHHSILVIDINFKYIFFNKYNSLSSRLLVNTNIHLSSGSCRIHEGILKSRGLGQREPSSVRSVRFWDKLKPSEACCSKDDWFNPGSTENSQQIFQQLVYNFRNISLQILSGSIGVFFSEVIK